MKSILISSIFIILFFSGCDINSSNSKFMRFFDTTAPKAPRVVNSIPKYSRYILTLELKGEPYSIVVVDDKIYNQLDKNGYKKLFLFLKGEDGLKNIKLALEDAYGNRSESITVATIKDTQAPTITLKVKKLLA